MSSDSPPLGAVRGSFRPKLSGSLPIAGRGRCSWTAEALILESRRPNLLVPLLAFMNAS